MSTYNIEQGSVFSTSENCHFTLLLKKQKLRNVKLNLISLNQLLLKNIYTAKLQVLNATNPSTLKVF